MKKTFLILCLILLTGCGKETIINDCFLGLKLNATIYLNNAEYNDLQVYPSYVIKNNLQGRNVLIIRQKENVYKAFDLQCPEKDCTTSMTFDGLKIICPCTKKEYNSLNGSPIDGQGCFALEYNVTQNGATLLVSR